MDYFKSLPVENTLDILTRLPTESALECKLVCSNWRNLVSHHPSFRKVHFHRLNNPSNVAAADTGKLGFIADSISSDDKYHYFECIDDESTNPIQRIRRINLTSPIRDSVFVNSCNGLMCLARGPLVWICNPITREYAVLPKINNYCNLKQYRNWTIGFGYVSSVNEYKILGIFVSDINIAVYIYTLGSGNGWRNLGKFNVGAGREWDQCVFANEALYWLDTGLGKIINFDLAEEKFGEHLSPPPLPQDCDWCDTRIGVVNGVLFFAIGLEVEGDKFNDIWLLKGEDEHQSLVWSKEFRIDKSKLFAIMKNDCLLTYGDYNYLNIYDIKTSTSKRLVKFKNCLYRVSLHQNTLVSLREIGEEDINVMESVEIEGTRSREYSFEVAPGGCET